MKDEQIAILAYFLKHAKWRNLKDKVHWQISISEKKYTSYYNCFKVERHDPEREVILTIYDPQRKDIEFKIDGDEYLNIAKEIVIKHKNIWEKFAEVTWGEDRLEGRIQHYDWMHKPEYWLSDAKWAVENWNSKGDLAKETRKSNLKTKFIEIKKCVGAD
jgi:hypothetical protein